MRFMDLLAKRYASPFIVLEEMLRFGRFYEFVVEINAITAEETQEAQLWDIWLHKIFDKEWSEWRSNIGKQSETQPITETELEATVLFSNELLKNFNLENTE